MWYQGCFLMCRGWQRHKNMDKLFAKCSFCNMVNGYFSTMPSFSIPKSTIICPFRCACITQCHGTIPYGNSCHAIVKVILYLVLNGGTKGFRYFPERVNLRKNLSPVGGICIKITLEFCPVHEHCHNFTPARMVDVEEGVSICHNSEGIGVINWLKIEASDTIQNGTVLKAYEVFD